MKKLQLLFVLLTFFFIEIATAQSQLAGKEGKECLRRTEVVQREGSYFVTCGGLTYMTDPKKSFVSGGYHSFTRFGKTEWIGKIGSKHDLLDKDGNFILGSYHEIRRTSSGYIVETGALTFILDTNGQIKR